MKTKALRRTDVLARGVLASAVACGVCLLLFGYAMAGPVVQPANQGTTGGSQGGMPGYLSEDSWELGILPPSDDSTTGRQSGTKVPPSSGGQPSLGGQPPAAYQPSPQTMPVPPTYAPGSPGARSQSGAADPYAGMPLPPTSQGLWDSPTSGGATAGAGAFRTGYGTGGMTGPGQQQMGGFSGYGPPPIPTPTSSIGQAALADPSFGRYDSQSVREATAARPPATFGQSQSQILRGGKPFADYRPSSAYSPYMRLASDLNRMNMGSNAYYDWVKPLLDQQQQNRQVNRSIGGLSDTARAGYQSIENMRQRPGNTIQNVGPRNPATFMNTGQYYPGLSRSR